MFGAISLSHDAAARLSDGTWSVFEGDEYKSGPTDPTAKFFYYKPTHLLLSAVSWDHADLYPTEDDYFNAFKKLVTGIPISGMIVANADNSGVAQVIGKANCKVIKYGKENADYTYANVKQTESGLTFSISQNGNLYEIASPMLGAFQAENITGCFAMAREIGIPAEKILSAISLFKGMKRRLEKRLGGDIAVIDDIAHSPEKAASILSNLRQIYAGKVIAIFEPNIGGRRVESIAKYDNAFKDATIVIIPRLTKLKISEDGSEKPLEGEDLAKAITKTHSNVVHIDADDQLVEYLVQNAKKGDVIAFLGSHGFRGMIEETVNALKEHMQ
jgi:UDP-N-acetylmuramate: L-alanyl-gamma-D-glutamyl-meso-diaminopimelate ligase